jgi:hypothetical protein
MPSAASAAASTPSVLPGAAPRQPPHWEKIVLYAFLRMLGSSQKDAASAVGRKKRTVQDWQADKPLYAQAREEARPRWMQELTDASRQTLLATIRAGAGELALKVLERVDADLAPATQRHKVEHQVGEGLSGLLKAWGGDHADTD